MSNDAPVWSRKWLRRLSWRKVQEMLRWFRVHPLEDPYVVFGSERRSRLLQKSRYNRLEQEWTRRKRDGGGGMAAP